MKYLLIILLLSGCYTARKAGQQTDKAYSHYPAMVAAKSAVWFPCIITDSSTVIDTVFNDSSSFYNHTIDSLLKIKSKVKDSLAIRYKDSCRSVYDNFQQGFNLGYEVGRYEGLRDCTPDTMRIVKTIKILDSAKIFLANNEVVLVKKQLAKMEKKKNTWNTIAVIGWILAILGFAFIYFKKLL